MAAAPQYSIPKQGESWSDVKAAYRLLSNPKVDPRAIGEPHRQRTQQACEGRPVVLAVQDDSAISFNTRTKVKGLGRLNAGGQGFIQHTALAVDPDNGQMMGMLDQVWFNRVDPPEGETRRQRSKRWRETDVWSDTVRRIGSGPVGTRFIHVMDRAGDSLKTIETCVQMGAGFVIRAMHDRRVECATSYLWPHLEQQPLAGTLPVTVGAQRDERGRVTRQGREAEVTVRYARVRLEPPWNSPGPRDPQTVWAVYVREENAPEGVEPIDWMVLTSEAVETFEDARRILRWYQRRWVIEEWHRAEKEGCRLEASQLDDAKDLQRLAAIVSVIAVRLIQLRDLAGECIEAERTSTPDRSASAGSDADHSAALRLAVAPEWILVVAGLAKASADRLTPREFWHRIARQGGWLGRKSDGRPGWKSIWRGWYDIEMMVRGVELHRQALDERHKCG